MKLRIEVSEVVQRYVNGESSEEIAVDSGVSSRQIRNILKDNGVEMRQIKRKPIYGVDTDFFKRWTADMAYVLGFVLTDGCVSGNSFSIAQKDPEILKRIGSVLKSNYPIRRRKNGKNYLYTLTISRKEMVADLAALGITEKKSLTVELPQVPDDYMPHFIRGVIDGDGWVHKRGYTAMVTSGSPIFAYQLHEVFNRVGLNGSLKKQSGAYRIQVSGKEDIARLGASLYENAGELYLQRKRARFERHAS